MEILNNTPFEVEALPSKDPEGKTFLTIIIKGTFDIRPREAATVSPEQIPVAYGDVLYDGNRGGSVKFEADIAPFKPRADIALVGRAYAPGGRPIQFLSASLRVGKVSKTISIIGNRFWDCSSCLFPEIPSKPKSFTVMDLVYERAFGGIDTEYGGWCRENPVGQGFFTRKTKKSLHCAPLPNLEDPHNPIKSWKDHPKPVGFGFCSKAWMPRAGYLGTYDGKWREERSPDPPKDFRFDYYNAAHPDLQVEGYLRGDEEVEMVNLTPNGNIQFQLPGVKLICTVTKDSSIKAEEDLKGNGEQETGKEFVKKLGENVEEFKYGLNRYFDEYENITEYEEFEETEEPSTITEEVKLNLDTLCFIPDEERLYLVWRGICPINDLTSLEIQTIDIRSINYYRNIENKSSSYTMKEP